MKKTYVAAIAIVAASVLVLAAAVALLQLPSPASSGELAIMGADPAIAASGVSDATITYSSVMAHQAGYSNTTGWTQVSGSGTMDLNASQGTVQTMAVSQVKATTYDAFRFNVDSCKVVYHGQTYAATVASTTLTAQSENTVHVNSTSSAAAVVDLRTFIVNTANSSNPQFIFSATAVATGVPRSTTSSLSPQLGVTVDLSAQAWWTTFMTETSTNVYLTGTLSSGSLVLHVQNAGIARAQVQEIILTPVSGFVLLTTSLPASLGGSAVFTVDGSGSVKQSTSLQASTLIDAGANVASGASTTLDFSGNIALNSSLGGVQVTGILAGQEYVVTCVGANTYASTTVVAS